jgi:hypothetical protein
MTLVGAANAALAAVQLGLAEADAPLWVNIIVAALIAGTGFVLGKTNSGTGRRKDRS